MKTVSLFLSAWLLALGSATAAVQHRAVEYRHGDAVLEGYLAWDDAAPAGRRPGVLVVHEWKGLGDYAKSRADQLAALGYVAFAVDMYGKGVYAKTHEEAGRLAGIYRQDRRLMRDRIRAGLEALRTQPQVDDTRIAAIGYCFGGTTVLELARSGADIRGVVSFHGGLSTPHPHDARQIKARLLVNHGDEDRFTSAADLEAFREEMRQAGVDWQLIIYGGAVHSFTVPTAGDDKSTGVAYNAAADRRSWAAMRAFLADIFK